MDGIQPPGSAENAGGFEWITGESFGYTNWNTGEPNNAGGAEESVHFFNTSGNWNDIGRYDPYVITGYIVEYDEFGDTELTTHDDNLNVQTAEIDAAVAAVEAKLDNTTTGLGAIVGDIADLDLDVVAVEAKLDNTTTGLGAIASDIADLDGDVIAVEAKLDNTTTGLGAIVGDIADLDLDVQAVESKLDLHDIDTANINLFFGALADNVLAMKKVDMQVIEIQHKKRYLLVTTEAGLPVDIALVAVQVSDKKKKNNPITWQDVTANATWTIAKPGMLDVKLNLPNSAKSAKLIEFRVVHDHGTVVPLGTVKHWGMEVESLTGGDDDD